MDGWTGRLEGEFQSDQWIQLYCVNWGTRYVKKKNQEKHESRIKYRKVQEFLGCSHIMGEFLYLG